LDNQNIKVDLRYSRAKGVSLLRFVELDYELRALDKGYNNRTLYVNLSEMMIKEKPVSDQMKKIFVGGKGFDLWLLWNALPWDRTIKWNDPENEICIACGPLGGTTVYPGSGKSIAVSISPLTGSIIDSNVGGYFGPYMKFSGWDAVEIQGKAKSDVVIVIDGDSGKVYIEEGSDLPKETHILGELLTAKYGKENKRSISTVTAGSGAKHTYFGCLNFSFYDTQRRVVRYKQAGRGGIGTVLREKNILAIVAKKEYPSPKWIINTKEIPTLREG
jgi:aldehyde:ferredoxin oxidoreductase